MTRGITKLIHKYLRHDKKFPHVWCAGCGNGIVLGSLIRSIDSLGVNKDKVVLVSGIGCAGRMSVYVDFNTLHTTHGRALTFATGIKLARPELLVIVVMGDGDALSIGGNHFIHAARRNLDITCIIVNNSIYGMTGGQYSPATPYGAYATTAPYGNIEHSFPIAEMAVVAGAPFVARGTVYHTHLLDKVMKKGMETKGFSVIEVISTCPTQFGRKNNMPDPVSMMRWLKESAIKVEKAKELSEEEMAKRFTIGVLVDIKKPIYHDDYKKILEKANKV